LKNSESETVCAGWKIPFFICSNKLEKNAAYGTPGIDWMMFRRYGNPNLSFLFIALT